MNNQHEHKAKYINPYTDFGFKRLFGIDANKDLLIDFLNQLLPQKHQIKSLFFKNNENLSDLPEERKAIFDIHCESTTGERFIVEMQKAKIKFFKDRALFYVTFPIREQAEKGIWNFELNPIYYITLLDFEYEERDEKNNKIPKFRRDIMLLDINTFEVFYEKLKLIFMQMPAFDKKDDELKTHYDKWCYFIKNLETFDDIPAILNEPIFKKAFSTTRVANLSPEEYKKYIESLDAYRELKGVKEAAKEEGVKEGEENAEKKYKPLLEKERRQKEEAQIKLALKMLKYKETIEDIIKDTGLSKEQIEELKRKHNL